MTRLVRYVVPSTCALLLFVSLMGSSSSTAGVDSAHTAVAAALSSAPFQHEAKDLNTLFADVSARTPAFGGLYRDPASGKLTVYLTDTRQAEATQQTIAGVFGTDRIPAEGVAVKEAKYGMSQLQTWHGAVNRLILGTQGLVMIDLDEANNRIFVGVQNDEAKSRIESKLAQLGLPADAISFGTAEINDTVALQGQVRPLVGGIAVTSGTECSAAFIADRSGVRGFVTASHCTTVTASYYTPIGTVMMTPELGFLTVK